MPNTKGVHAGDPNALLGRMMPESLAAEAAVLGSMIIDPECIGQVIETLNTEVFYRSEHKIIFDAVVGLYEKNKVEGLDGVLLRDELEKRKQLSDAGGVEYLGEILQSVPSSANVMYYAGIVKDKLTMRQIIQVATDILNQAYDEGGEPAYGQALSAPLPRTEREGGGRGFGAVPGFPRETARTGPDARSGGPDRRGALVRRQSPRTGRPPDRFPG